MRHLNLPDATVTVGLDVGYRYTRLCVVDAAGAVIEERRLPTTPVALERRFGQAEQMRIVLETGTHSPWMSRMLTTCGHEVIVANARRLRLIAASDSKNDRADAEALARIGRLDPALLSPIRHGKTRRSAPWRGSWRCSSIDSGSLAPRTSRFAPGACWQSVDQYTQSLNRPYDLIPVEPTL